jgi:hypothetical protein
MAEPAFAGDPLERLLARIEVAEAAAVRLAAEARAARGDDPGSGDPRAGSGGSAGAGGPGDEGDGAAGGNGSGHEGPPPRGWEVPGRTNAGDDLASLALIVDGLKGLIPPELQQRLADAVRNLLNAIRALIDWYLERVERRRGRDLQVEDIPID